MTSIVLTAALSAAGTYYVATKPPPDDQAVATTAAQPPVSQPIPVAVGVNPQANKPVEIIVKTEIVEKQTSHRDIVAEGIAFRKRPQPHLEVTKN
jgi:hypothetical protein